MPLPERTSASSSQPQAYTAGADYDFFQNEDGCASINHTHVSLAQFKERLANQSIQDDEFLEIFTQAKEHLLYCKNKYPESVPLKRSIRHCLNVGMNEDRVIIAICKKELMKIPEASSGSAAKKQE